MRTSTPTAALLSSLLSAAACTSSGQDPGGLGETGGGATTSTSAPDPDVPTTAANDPPASTTAATTTTSTGDDSTGASSLATTGTTGADTTGAAETTGAAGECGDGEIDPGETCDLGHGTNSDSGACTLQCETAKCGDGLLHVGKEQCDAGGDNNDATYGGCTTKCTLGPRCGDSSVNGPEECDLGAGNGTGDHTLDGVPCSNSCRHAGLLVFLSSATYTGGQLLGGYGADGRCQQLAVAAGLDNAQRFRAWISDDKSSPETRFGPPVDGLPYALPNGLRVADDREQLALSGPLTGITMTEQGAILYDARVWTDTTSAGTLLDKELDCSGWLSNSFEQKGRVGRSGVDKADFPAWQQWKNEGQWVDFNTLGCAHEYRLYCFET